MNPSDRKTGCNAPEGAYSLFQYLTNGVYLPACMMAACAAATRAMGTRNGEQLT